MKNIHNDQSFLSMQTVDTLNDASILLIALFLGHWQRVFCEHQEKSKIASWPELVRRTKNSESNTYFWQTILVELLSARRCSLVTLVGITQVDTSFWQNCLTKNSKINMPVSLGEQLLLLHDQLRPDLQQQSTANSNAD